MSLIQYYAIKQHQHLFAYIQLRVNDVDEATQDNNEIKNVPGIAKIILQEKNNYENEFSNYEMYSKTDLEPKGS